MLRCRNARRTRISPLASLTTPAATWPSAVMTASPSCFVSTGASSGIGRDLATVGPPLHLVDDFRYDDVKL
jgi:hypothetical protein